VGVGEQQVARLAHGLSMRQLAASENVASRSSIRPTLWVLFWMAVIVFLVFPIRSFTDHPHWERVQWIPFRGGPFRMRDVINNVLLYLPLGYAAFRLWPDAGVRRAVALAFLLSLTTEYVQVYSHRRYPSSGDLLCNTFGAWIGASIAQRLGQKAGGSRQRAVGRGQ
jgi:glycopeptide antibiotics resistance protein